MEKSKKFLYNVLSFSILMVLLTYLINFVLRLFVFFKMLDVVETSVELLNGMYSILPF